MRTTVATDQAYSNATHSPNAMRRERVWVGDGVDYISSAAASMASTASTLARVVAAPFTGPSSATHTLAAALAWTLEPVAVVNGVSFHALSTVSCCTSCLAAAESSLLTPWI